MERDDQRECRLCGHYQYDTDIEVLSFGCAKGHFQFEDRPGEGMVGQLPERGRVPADMPCNGKDFVLDPNSRWYRQERGLRQVS